MSNTPWREVRELASLVEAEACGRPFDRDRARHLASALAERHPEIRGTLQRIRDRTGNPSS